MATYWLVPLEWDGETAVFSEERFALAPADKRDRFVRALQAVHPRLLLAFKAHLLVADEALDACGTDDLPFALGSAGPIVLRSLELRRRLTRSLPRGGRFRIARKLIYRACLRPEKQPVC